MYPIILLHIKEITIKMGPLRALSRHSMERAIKGVSNLITSKYKPGVNSSNVNMKILHYSKYRITQTLDEMVIKKPKKWIVSYAILQMQAILYQSYGALLEKDNINRYGVSNQEAIDGIKVFYGRHCSLHAESLTINHDIVIAARAWKDDTILKSHFYSNINRLLIRSNNIVLFEGKNRNR